MKIPRNLAAFSAFALVAGSASAANVIVNGDFETGTLTGWTQPGNQGGTTITTTAPLSGTYSVVQTRVTDQMLQNFTPIASSVTTTFIF